MTVLIISGILIVIILSLPKYAFKEEEL